MGTVSPMTGRGLHSDFWRKAAAYQEFFEQKDVKRFDFGNGIYHRTASGWYLPSPSHLLGAGVDILYREGALDPGMPVIDFGAGDGRLGICFGMAGNSVILIEGDSHYAEQAKASVQMMRSRKVIGHLPCVIEADFADRNTYVDHEIPLDRPYCAVAYLTDRNHGNAARIVSSHFPGESVLVCARSEQQKSPLDLEGLVHQMTIHPSELLAHAQRQGIAVNKSLHHGLYADHFALHVYQKQ